MWDEIRAWYLANGYAAAAGAMWDIEREWRGSEDQLRQALISPRVARLIHPIYETRRS